MRQGHLLMAVSFFVLIFVASFFFLITQKPGSLFSPIEKSIEARMFSEYNSKTIESQLSEGLGSDVLPPTPDNATIYFLMLKSYDLNPEKTGLIYETLANDNEWCRVKRLTPSLWMYYFEDYHRYINQNQGSKSDLFFADVTALVWLVGDNLRIKFLESSVIFRNSMIVGGLPIVDNISAHYDETFEVPVPVKLRPNYSRQTGALIEGEVLPDD